MEDVFHKLVQRLTANYQDYHLWKDNQIGNMIVGCLRIIRMIFSGNKMLLIKWSAEKIRVYYVMLFKKRRGLFWHQLYPFQDDLIKSMLQFFHRVIEFLGKEPGSDTFGFREWVILDGQNKWRSYNNQILGKKICRYWFLKKLTAKD